MHRDASESFRDLLAAVPVSDQWRARLQALMSGRDRHYHGVDHVALLFDRHLCFGREAGFDGPAETRLVACAIAFHDCIYDSSRDDSEERSAQAWLEASATANLREKDRSWVAATIRATSDHLDYGERAGSAAATDRSEALRLWMLDLDLTPFGEAPDLFDRNTKLLREEAPHLDDQTFEEILFRSLKHYADAPVIFHSAALGDRFEAQARRNIARRLPKPFTGLPVST